MSDELFTPKWIFDALGVQFDLDVASSASPFVEVPTKRFLTIADDSLKQDWIGKVWMNPPFSKVTPWIEKWLDHANGFCLVPLSSNGRWITTLWESDAALTYLPTNMAFIGGQDGVMVKHRWRCSLWAIGEDNVKALENSGIGRIR
jgi:hypothetical protein